MRRRRAANKCKQGIARAQRWFIKYQGKKLSPAEVNGQIEAFASKSKCRVR
jgi:hypothetical protein